MVEDRPSHRVPRRKNIVVAYLGWFFGLHYLYLSKWKLLILYWITLWGLGLWWLVDAFRLPGLVAQANDVDIDYAPSPARQLAYGGAALAVGCAVMTAGLATLTAAAVVVATLMDETGGDRDNRDTVAAGDSLASDSIDGDTLDGDSVARDSLDGDSLAAESTSVAATSAERDPGRGASILIGADPSDPLRVSATFGPDQPVERLSVFEFDTDFESHSVAMIADIRDADDPLSVMLSGDGVSDIHTSAGDMARITVDRGVAEIAYATAGGDHGIERIDLSDDEEAEYERLRDRLTALSFPSRVTPSIASASNSAAIPVSRNMDTHEVFLLLSQVEIPVPELIDTTDDAEPENGWYYTFEIQGCRDDHVRCVPKRGLAWGCSDCPVTSMATIVHTVEVIAPSQISIAPAEIQTCLDSLRSEDASDWLELLGQLVGQLPGRFGELFEVAGTVQAIGEAKDTSSADCVERVLGTGMAELIEPAVDADALTVVITPFAQEGKEIQPPSASQSYEPYQWDRMDIGRTTLGLEHGDFPTFPPQTLPRVRFEVTSTASAMQYKGIFETSTLFEPALWPHVEFESNLVSLWLIDDKLEGIIELMAVAPSSFTCSEGCDDPGDMTVHCSAEVTLVSGQVEPDDLKSTGNGYSGSVSVHIAQAPGSGEDCAEANASGTYAVDVPASVQIERRGDRLTGTVEIEDLGQRFAFEAALVQPDR